MSLVRNGQAVLNILSDKPGQPVHTKSALDIQFPVRFADIGLAQLGVESYVYGLFVMILPNQQYALCNVNALMELGQAAIEIKTIDEVPYYNFHYEPGDVLFKTKDLVARSDLIFKAIDEFIFKGKVPWYVGYDDMGKIFDTAKKHAKTSANILPSVIEFMAAYVARKKGDRIKFIREGATSLKDFDLKHLEWVPMRSVFWSAPGSVNKLSGAYFSDGIVSALVNPSERAETIEKILRT